MALPPPVVAPTPSLTFTLPPRVPKFGPRVGRLTLVRDDDGASNSGSPPSLTITLDTPNILVGTSRGVVPHLSRDHVHASDAIRWLNVPFESFLEQVPPVPTLQTGPRPLHRFLGFDEGRHIVSLCLRDPLDVREMPPNGNTFVSANCARGVKKVTLEDWRKYAYKMRPDVVFALTDTPFTLPPYSQKRITKSIERSTAWVADILRPIPGGVSRRPLNVFVHMSGGTSLPAREAFAYGLQETLHGPEVDAVKSLRCLDEGIAGYAFDLAVLRSIKPNPNTSQHQSLPGDVLGADMLHHPKSTAEVPTPSTVDAENLTRSSVLSMAEPVGPPDMTLLLKASLEALSEQKPRLVTGIRSPHEMLRLIRDVGVDLFDVGWAMNAANVGVALDFCFPVPVAGARRSLGHNLYDRGYAHQFVRLADAFVGEGEGGAGGVMQGRVCPCVACSPRLPSSPVLHSTVDRQSHLTTNGDVHYGQPHSRAYLHHLLHTHEMSAHALLVSHNLAVVSAFLAGVRQVWVQCETQFALEVERFNSAYDEDGEVFVAAKRDWDYVDKARGKGRLAREREKQEDGQDG